MENQFLGKIYKKKSIKQHTQDLLDQYEILKKLYPNILKEQDWKILEYAIKYHDLGKINSKFQNKLYKILKEQSMDTNIKGEEIPHNFLSPYFINIDKMEEKYGREKTKILVSSVYYHHIRNEKEVTCDVLDDLRLQKENLGTFFDLDLKKIENSISRYVLKEKDESILKSRSYILVKGLLNKLDYVASLDNPKVNVEESYDQKGQTVSDIVRNIIETNYNKNYRDVQRYMMNHQNENLIVTSYTGSGKTEAALLWIGKNKAFYTLPLKVSINAMYQRIYNEIGFKKVLLLHSDSYSFYKDHIDSDINSYDRSKRLSSPLIITTIHQLFKIAFRYKGYEEILATLSYSKIILDEIQMYSPQLLAYILLGLKIITDIGGKFAIITATFPPVLYHFFDKLSIPYQTPKEKFTTHLSNRHKIKLLEDTEFDLNNIIKLSKNKKVLIVTNTVIRAQKLYDQLKQHAHLLHSHYIKEDRNYLEKNILEFGNHEKNSEVGIWISTQIVETSLDIDFDILFTEMCSIDSLFQRMGRIYRKRNYNKELPNIYILDNRNGVPFIIDSYIYDCSLEEIKKYNNNNLSEELKQTIINNIFSLDKNKSLRDSEYYKIINKEIIELSNIMPNQISKKCIDKRFENTQNINLMPYEIFKRLSEEGKIEEWEKILSNNNIPNIKKLEIKNIISKYIVSVRYNNKLIYDKQELFYKGSHIYYTQYKYDFDNIELKGKGLIIDNNIITNKE